MAPGRLTRHGSLGAPDGRGLGLGAAVVDVGVATVLTRERERAQRAVLLRLGWLHLSGCMITGCGVRRSRCGRSAPQPVIMSGVRCPVSGTVVRSGTCPGGGRPARPPARVRSVITSLVNQIGIGGVDTTG
ncbi:hypothetical protein Ae331Ps2_3076 [Pseudonocardia sp. Ae331_Ps2]|nr:hypothetical protein Ae331Ps2_3076 [Pseudonocardia sp. Ae331_Ps2]